MFVIDKMKLNRFRAVSIPKNRDLFLRVGARALPPMQDGQVADYTNGVMDEMDALEAQVVRENTKPSDKED